MELQRSERAQADGAARASHYGKMMEFVLSHVFSGRVRTDSDSSVSVYYSVVTYLIMCVGF